MEPIVIKMSQTEYKRYLAFKQADKIAQSIRRGMREVEQARTGGVKLKSARQLAYEL